MSKGKLSDSLDLLLDTMCNTFGGVVFIAISLALAFFVCRDQFSENNQPEKIAKKLQEEQKRKTALTEEIERLNKKITALKNLSIQYENKKTGSPEAVINLEQELKTIKRNIDATEAESALVKYQKNISQAEIEKKENSIKEKEKVIAQTEQLLQERQQLNLQINELLEQLNNISVPRLHFARNQRVSTTPYVVLIKNNCLYRLGENYFSSSSEINVRKDNNMLILSPVNGTLLSTVSNNNLSNILHNFNKQRLFLWIIVHPDSLDSFIKFRRILRQGSYQVHWYIKDNAVIYLSDNVNYSASY